MLRNIFKMPLALGHWANRALTSTTTSVNALQQQRFKATKMNCTHMEPKCGDRFQKKPCDPQQLDVILKQPAPKPLPVKERVFKFKHPPECCGNPCADVFPRFDLLYYKRTDKLNREYQQTWAECPELIRKPKVICYFDKIQLPKWKKRPRKQRPQTACKQTCANINYKCPRTKLEGCRQARIPPKCTQIPPKSNCKKRKAPFPAFSECSRPLPRPGYPIECSCLLTPSMCEIWVHYFRMKRIKKTGLC